MPSGQDQIAVLTAQVTKATTVETSAQKLVEGIAQRIADAVAAVIANGVTPEQIQPLTDLGTTLDAESDALSAAVLANTPAATGTRPK